VKWFRLAADQGAAAVQFNLGRTYEIGRGVPQSYAEAMKWYRKAADQGDAAAQFNLGTLYYNGRGVAQDLVEAHKWYTLAASRFPGPMAANRQRAVNNRQLVAAKMTPSQIVEAQRLVSEWKPK
jgi:TPR repeat protein